MRRRAAAGLSWAPAAAAAFSRRRELGSAMKAAEGLNTWPPAAPGPEKVEKENVENIPKQKTDRQGLVFICLISVLLFSIIALMEIPISYQNFLFSIFYFSFLSPKRSLVSEPLPYVGFSCQLKTRAVKNDHKINHF